MVHREFMQTCAGNGVIWLRSEAVGVASCRGGVRSARQYTKVIDWPEGRGMSADVRAAVAWVRMEFRLGMRDSCAGIHGSAVDACLRL